MQVAELTNKGSSIAVVEHPDPAVLPHEVVVELRAAALNHRDVWITKGLYPGIVYPVVPGSDGAGLVHAVGDQVDGWQPGDEVIINPGFDWGDDPRAQHDDFTILGCPRQGTLASLCAIPAQQLVRKPVHLDWPQAAALPLAALTAYRALFARARLQAGETVLVSGIGGGVALFALQFAYAAGANVVVTSSSAEKRERACELGATAAWDYREEQWSERLKQAIGGVDVVIDGAAGPSMNAHSDACRPGGRIVIYGGTAGLPEGMNVRQVFWKQLNIMGSTMGSPDDFAAMLEFVAKHQLVPVVDQVFPMLHVADAFARMDAGEQFGKIVVTM